MTLRISAIGRRNRQIVVVVDMAERTGHVRVPRGQKETCRAVIEGCRRPADGSVAR